MASGGALGGGHQNTTKDIGAPLSLSVIKIVKYSGVWGGDAFGGGGGKILQKIMVPPLCHCDN